MAKRKSGSKVRPRRSSASPQTKVSPSGKGASSSTSHNLSAANLEALEDAIEDERVRLMKAHSVLSCITLAMEGDDGADKDGPHYPSMIEIARDLINESIRRLDWGKLELLLAARK